MFDQYAAAVGANLQVARQRAGLTQRAAAARMMPVSTAQTMSFWETGRKTPTLWRLLDACRVYNVTLGAILPVPVRDTLLVPGPALRAATAPALSPLASWADAYGTDCITVSPTVLDHGARLCGVDPDSLYELLLPLSTVSSRHAQWLNPDAVPVPEPR